MKPLMLILSGLILLAGTPVLPLHTEPWRLPFPVPITVPIVKPAATAATYVYEKDSTPVPVGVTAGINRLNRERKVVASLFEADTVDGSGEVPDQYRPALEAAKKDGLPALVVLSGASVVKVVKSPKTEDEVVGAVP